MSIREWIAEFNENAILYDGYEDAILGVASRVGMKPVVAYDRRKCIEILMTEENATGGWAGEMSYDDAEEAFERNTAGGWVGENTPVIMVLWADSRKAWED